MAITGVHTILYTPEAAALRDALREAFGWRHIDAGDGWLIFALPPAEMGVHPGESPSHQVSFTCDDLDATVADLQAKGIEFEGSPQQAGFGRTVTMVLPGAVKVMLYQPRHPTAY